MNSAFDPFTQFNSLEPDSQHSKHSSYQPLTPYNNEETITLLVEMGFTMKAAVFCLQLTGSNDIDQILQFITSEENGFYNHPFLDEQPNKTCLICSDIESKHVQSVGIEQLDQLKCILRIHFIC